MPFQDIQSESIIGIPDLISSAPMLSGGNGFFALVTFKKSSKTVKYTRTFNKIDSYFSYVGGLVGTIIGLIFIMGPYTEKSYEISLAKKTMVDNDREEIPSQSFNIGYFFLMYVKRFLNSIKIEPDWPKVQKFTEVSNEATSQLDVTYIIRKLMFMDASISKLMEKHEIEVLCMRE